MTTPNNSRDALLNEHEVAALLNVSVATIRRRRLFRQPPDWVKLGASVRYTRAAVDRVIESSRVRTQEAR
jgi:predicted DNA-binding transcriptional regulator AlpA